MEIKITIKHNNKEYIYNFNDTPSIITDKIKKILKDLEKLLKWN